MGGEEDDASDDDEARSARGDEEAAEEEAEEQEEEPKVESTDEKADRRLLTSMKKGPKVELDEETKRRIEAITLDPKLPSPSVPRRPSLHAGMSMQQKLNAVSRFIKEFEYNHTGEVYFQMRRDRGLKHVVITAKDIMRDALPIQCVEAVFLAAFLTAELEDLDRYPLAFKSVAGESAFRHIVLACHDRRRDRWGALGLSRRACLQNKDLRFGSLSALVDAYARAYAKCGHELVRVYVGLPLTHDVHSVVAIRWRVLKVSLWSHPWADVAEVIDAYVRDITKVARARGDAALQTFKAPKLEAATTTADGKVATNASSDDDVALVAPQAPVLSHDPGDETHPAEAPAPAITKAPPVIGV